MTDNDPELGDHDLWEALAVGSAMRALEPHDDALFREHLRDCDRCAEILRESGELVAALAVASEAAEPPAGLRDRIVAISRESGAAVAAAAVAPVVADEVARRRALGRSVSPVARWAVAAAVVSALASSGVTYALTHRTPGPGASIAVQCVLDPSCRHLSLETTNGPIGAVLLEKDKTYVVTPDLPKSGAQDEYVVWTGDASGKMTALTAFRVTGSDAFHLLDKVPDLTGVTAMAISKEARTAQLPAQPSTPLGIATVPPAA